MPLEGSAGFAGATIFWINLDRRVDRRAHMEQQLAHWTGDVVRIPAVDGARDVDPVDVEIYLAGMDPVRRASRRLTDDGPGYDPRAEIACARSHARALRMALNRDVFPCIVLEDDAIIRVSLASNPPPDGWQLALLGGQPKFPEKAALAETAPGWFRLTSPEWFQTTGYVVADAQSAMVLLAALSRENYPADLLLWPILGELRTWGAEPRRVVQNPRLKSSIYTPRPRSR